MDKRKGLMMGFSAYENVFSENFQGLEEVVGKGQRINDDRDPIGKQTN